MFRTRLLSGICLVAVALVTIIYGKWLLTAALLLISLLAYMELTRACKIHTEGVFYNALELLGIAAILIYYILLYLQVPQIILIMDIVVTFIAYLFVYVFSFPCYVSDKVMSAFFSFLYAPIMFSFIYLTRNMEAGKYLVWLIFISSWGCDTCAYCVGMICGKLFGNHKMAPRLSPKKSIEGAVGGVVGAALLGALYAELLVGKKIPDQNIIWIFALIGAVGGLISMVGDLAASAIKRNHDIKDYGKCIPGHGGIMDRFDSVIITAPMIYFLSMLLL